MTIRQLNVHFDLDGNSGRDAELFGRTSPSSMRVYDLIVQQGRPFVTEVVLSIGRNAICHVIQQIPIRRFCAALDSFRGFRKNSSASLTSAGRGLS